MTDSAVRIAATLDTAWVAAEQALGEYWRIRSLTEVSPHGWEAVATDGNRIHRGLGQTPLGALRALSVSRAAADRMDEVMNP